MSSTTSLRTSLDQLGSRGRSSPSSANTSRSASLSPQRGRGVSGTGVSIRDVTHNENDEDDDEDADEYKLQSSFLHAPSAASTARVQRLAASLHTHIAQPNATTVQSPSRRWSSNASASPLRNLKGLSSTSSSSRNSPSSSGRSSFSPTKLHRPSSSALSPSSSASAASLSATSYFARSTMNGLGAASNISGALEANTEILTLKKQLADQELATVQERNKRISLQGQVDLYASQSSHGMDASEKNVSGTASASANGAATDLSQTTFFNHLHLDAHPDLAQWNKHLRTVCEQQGHKILSMENLIAEQSRAMNQQREERMDREHRTQLEFNTLQQHFQSCQQDLLLLQEQYTGLQSRFHTTSTQLTHTQNELTLVTEHAQRDVGALLQKLETATQENASLRQAVQQEHAKFLHTQEELRLATGQIEDLKGSQATAQASAVKYKGKARELVERVRELDAIRSTLSNQLRLAKQEKEESRELIEDLSSQISKQKGEYSLILSQHDDLRSELLGKTSELTQLYQQYESTIATHQQHKQMWEQRMRDLQQEATDALKERDQRHKDTLKHHEFITQLSAPVALQTQTPTPNSPTKPLIPLSQQLHLDLHRALAEKAQEVLALRTKVEELTKEIHLRPLTKHHSHASHHQQGAATGGDEPLIQQELHSLRSRLDRRTMENTELSSQVLSLEGKIAVLQRKLGKYGAAASAAPETAQPLSQQQSQSNTEHLYQQIVSLHEQLSTFERQVAEKESALTQLRATLLVEQQTRKALEEQVSTLSTHLAEFKSKDLPTPQEYRLKLESQRKEWQAQMDELQAKEEQWRKQVVQEREELLSKQASEESFILHAISIHTEEISSEVDSLSALMSSRQNGMEPGIEHLVPKQTVHDSKLNLQQTEEVLSKTVSDLRSLRRYVADEYAKGLSNECITQ